MAKIFKASDAVHLTGSLRTQAYNALDCCVPQEAFANLVEELDPHSQRVYDFERSMQGPAFSMTLRGACVDETRCAATIDRLEKAEKRCEDVLSVLAQVWGAEGPINPRSVPQVQALFYGLCGEKPYLAKAKKDEVDDEEEDDGTDNSKTNPWRGTTVNEEALSLMRVRSPVVGTMCTLILRAREVRKQLGFLRARRSPDGRLRSAFNVGGTKTGRWSFCQTPTKEGLNFGNIEHGSRVIFVASSPSRVLVNVDLKQAESCIVAHICNDPAYIRVHETGDSHSALAYDLFGYSPKEAKTLRMANGETVRQACKKLQHGTNYGLGEKHSAIMMMLRLGKVRELRRLYFTKYKRVAQRIIDMPMRLKDNPYILSFMGRPHFFFGHWNDHKTIKEALADEPQGGVADILNIALFRIWKKYDGRDLWLLLQNYDSILFEVERADLNRVLPLVAAEMKVPVEINGRTVCLGCDFKVGDNWGEMEDYEVV